MNMENYTDHHCVLERKYRTPFHYVWILNDNGTRFRVNVGKALYDGIAIGDKLTIGRCKRRLINVRSGFCKIEKE